MSEVRVLADAEALAKEASKAIAERIRAAEGQRFTLAVSGGSTPKRMFQHLARETLNWSKVHLFWVDERCVPPDHAESNYRMTAENLLSDVNLPAGQIHRMRGELLPAAGAEVYETELKSFFGADALPRFDLILLGMGDDGHTASIFPDSPLLDEKDRWAA
ncbi:MAG: 6-phosphogluconolactonase, partial [Anaerolineaceae bacterium]|nr:6-phosphogluconolactonase [Anaerolineaceae bacterium]